jgi:hypothetical protein
VGILSVPRRTDATWPHVVYVFFHLTNIYSCEVARLIFSDSISSSLSPSSLHRGACDSPPHLELTCLSARGAHQLLVLVLARHGVLVGCCPLARGAVGGARLLAE